MTSIAKRLMWLLCSNKVDHAFSSMCRWLALWWLRAEVAVACNRKEHRDIKTRWVSSSVRIKFGTEKSVFADCT